MPPPRDRPLGCPGGPLKRIKVGFYVHEWTYAGTARSHLRILEALDRERFEPYALVWNKGQNDLLPALERILGDRVIPFRRSEDKTGPEGAYSPIATDFYRMATSLNLDILHHARGGYFEWPLSTYRIAPLQVETNIFGDLDDSRYLDRSIAICQYIADRRGKTDAVIYNPIPAAKPGPTLRDKLPIPKDAILCGRIGRPGNFDSIALEAFMRVQKEYPNLWYLVVAPCLQFTDYAYTHGAKNVLCFPPTTDDAWIESFYRTLDIFCHYRRDGEVHSTAIAQAMMYGVPVISHRSAVHNGQMETIGSGGYVAESEGDYSAFIRLLLDEELRSGAGVFANSRAADFAQSNIVHQIEAKYLEWLK